MQIIATVHERARQTPAAFGTWARENGWGESYIKRHFLYVATYPEPVRELLRRGYPIRRIPLKKVDCAALESALQGENWRDDVEQLFGHAQFPEWAERPVWLFDSTPELRAREGLARQVAELLIERYCPPRGLVVDPMAGSGELVRAAERTGRLVWGGDVQPNSSEIVQADVANLLSHVALSSADTLILHPPTFGAWSKQTGKLVGSPESEHYVLYLEFIASLLQATRPAVKSGGKVVLIARPPRTGQVYLAPFELALGEQQLTLEAYQLAISRDGREDWHFFVARAT